MIKKIALGLSSLAIAIAPLAASAATVTNVEFDNGDVTTSGTGGTTVNAMFRIVVGPNEVVEFVQTDTIGDNLGPKDHSVGGTLGLEEGTHEVTLPVKHAPNTGTYNLTARPAGIYGGIRSVSGNDGVNGPTATFTGALRTVANASAGTGGSNPFQEQLDALTLLVEALTKSVADLAKPTTPTIPSACVTLASKLVGTMMYTYNSSNSALQGFLISELTSQNNPTPIPALARGASYGFYGEQTATAVASFKAQKGCN